MAFIKNEKCFKSCTVDFDKATTQKGIRIFSKYLPELVDQIILNENMEKIKQENQKIEEIKQKYEGFKNWE